MSKSTTWMVMGVLTLSLLAVPTPKALAAGAESDAATRRLFAAVQANDLSAAQASVAAGADPRAANPMGLTAIDLAIDRGYFPIAHYLVAVAQQTEKHRSEGPEAAKANVAATPIANPAASRAFEAAPVTRRSTPPRPSTPPGDPFDPFAAAFGTVSTPGRP